MAAKSLRCKDATTRKLLSPESVWSSTRPNKYRDAIIKAVELMDTSEDDAVKLKAAQFIINHEKGTPKQALDLTTKNESLNAFPDISNLSPEAIDKIQNAIDAIEQG